MQQITRLHIIFESLPNYAVITVTRFSQFESYQSKLIVTGRYTLEVHLLLNIIYVAGGLKWTNEKWRKVMQLKMEWNIKYWFELSWQQVTGPECRKTDELSSIDSQSVHSQRKLIIHTSIRLWRSINTLITRVCYLTSGDGLKWWSTNSK